MDSPIRKNRNLFGCENRALDSTVGDRGKKLNEKNPHCFAEINEVNLPVRKAMLRSEG